MKENKIQKTDLNKVFWRMQFLNITNNFESMQAIGFLSSFAPILEKLYKNEDKETRVKAMKRHLKFFNSHVNSDALILGITAAMEEQTAENEKDGVVSIKTGLMGPLAGIGDSLLKFTWLPICGGIGASLALDGNGFGPIIMFLLYNIVNIATKYYGIHKGYEKGLYFLEKGDSDIVQRVSSMANVVGLMVVGGLISTAVKFNIAYTFTVGENTVEIQEMLDKVMPGFMSLLISVLIYHLMKKLNGKHTPLVILGIMVVGILLTMIGII